MRETEKEREEVERATERKRRYMERWGGRKRGEGGERKMKNER